MRSVLSSSPSLVKYMDIVAGAGLLPPILAIMSFGNENSSDRYGVLEWRREW